MHCIVAIADAMLPVEVLYDASMTMGGAVSNPSRGSGDITLFSFGYWGRVAGQNR
jgi:hypothetical protein